MTAKTFTTTHLATIYPHQTSVTLHGHFHLSVIYSKRYEINPARQPLTVPDPLSE